MPPGRHLEDNTAIVSAAVSGRTIKVSGAVTRHGPIRGLAIRAPGLRAEAVEDALRVRCGHLEDRSVAKLAAASSGSVNVARSV